MRVHARDAVYVVMRAVYKNHARSQFAEHLLIKQLEAMILMDPDEKCVELEVHGNGVHLDNLETRDERLLLDGTLVSVEPGVYFESFGMRTEVNLLIDGSSVVRRSNRVEKAGTSSNAIGEKPTGGCF